MAAALAQAGLVASQTGLTLEETTGGLAAFASAGLLGSDAGTSLKTALQRLTPQSAEAAGLMDELGLRAYDAQGQFVGLSEYAGMLWWSLGAPLSSPPGGPAAVETAVRALGAPNSAPVGGAGPEHLKPRDLRDCSPTA